VRNHFVRRGLPTEYRNNDHDSSHPPWLNPYIHQESWAMHSTRDDTSRESFEGLLASLVMLAWVVEARDPYTGGHLWRVSQYARALAEASDLPPAEVARIALGALLHDLGKIGIPDAILRKPDRLTDEERQIIETHPVLGARMLSGHPLKVLVGDMVLLHHLRPDGLGYPVGTTAPAGTAACIVAVCDAFDAMTSHRPFRKGMPLEHALAVLEQFAGEQFDAALARRFIVLARTGAFAHILGHADEGIPLQQCPLCGPTLVVRRKQRAGEHINCPNCGSDFELHEPNAGLVARPTGARHAARLIPDPDQALIGRLVRDTVRILPIELLQGTWQQGLAPR